MDGIFAYGGFGFLFNTANGALLGLALLSFLSGPNIR
ncbi:unannotated protein [freshwater metagenome]|uniref:Unannotated protein n=1 Tax=freshwater metagenome TaxID=449393 RepID=A0A6J6EIG3_9ZZZZ